MPFRNVVDLQWVTLRVIPEEDGILQFSQHLKRSSFVRLRNEWFRSIYIFPKSAVEVTSQTSPNVSQTEKHWSMQNRRLSDTSHKCLLSVFPSIPSQSVFSFPLKTSCESSHKDLHCLFVVLYVRYIETCYLIPWNISIHSLGYFPPVLKFLISRHLLIDVSKFWCADMFHFVFRQQVIISCRTGRV